MNGGQRGSQDDLEPPISVSETATPPDCCLSTPRIDPVPAGTNSTTAVLARRLHTPEGVQPDSKNTCRGRETVEDEVHSF